MNIGDKYIIKSKTFIVKGFAPTGSIIEVTKIKNNNVEVIIAPFISNNARINLETTITKDFIKCCSTKIN